MKQLDLSFNNISEVHNMFFQQSMRRIEMFNLSFNDIDFLHFNNSHKHHVAVKKLYFNNCGIKMISNSCFDNMNQLAYVDLQNNQIQQFAELYTPTLLDQIVLFGNPIECWKHVKTC